MKRPVGVILSSIALGLLAAVQLVFAAGMALAAYAIGSHGLGTFPPPGSEAAATPPPPLMVILAVCAAMAIFLVLLAVWEIVTIVGLVRLRNWARYSVLVLGGCMAALGLMSVFGTVVALALPSQFAPTPNPSPLMMQAVLLITALFYASIAAVGIWWLIYFNLRAVKTAFQPIVAPSHNPYLFEAAPAAPLGYPGLAAAPAPSSPATPVPVIGIACFFLLSTFGCFIALFLPFPAFLYGFILTGPVVKAVVYIALGLLMAAIAIGLLRRDNRARLATYGLIALGAINLCLLATPWYRDRFRTYNLHLQESLRPAWVPPTPPFVYSGAMMALSALIGIAVYAAIVWILHRYRGAFTHPAS